jgi:TRAP-type C4-dicarboxylate transport system permease large subunit
MITASEMYWLTRLDSFHEFTSGIGILLSVLFGIASVIVWGIYGVSSSYPEESRNHDMTEAVTVTRRLRWPLLIVFILGLTLKLGSMFIPTTKEYAAIKVIPMLANDKVKEDFGELYELTVEWAKTKLELPKEAE